MFPARMLSQSLPRRCSGWRLLAFVLVFFCVQQWLSVHPYGHDHAGHGQSEHCSICLAFSGGTAGPVALPSLTAPALTFFLAPVFLLPVWPGRRLPAFLSRAPPQLPI